METLETIFYYLQTLKLLHILQNCQAPGLVPGPSQHSYSKERTWIDTIIKQATTTKLFKGGNWNSSYLTTQNLKGVDLD